MIKSKYTILDHTADFGIKVTGTDQKDLFANAALAMYDCIADSTFLAGDNTAAIRIEGADKCDLMVNWLRELLYLWNGRSMLIRTIHIPSISENQLSASVTYDVFDPDIHKIKNEIKAVTYHQISVEQTANGWESRIIFDV